MTMRKLVWVFPQWCRDGGQLLRRIYVEKTTRRVQYAIWSGPLRGGKVWRRCAEAVHYKAAEPPEGMAPGRPFCLAIRGPACPECRAVFVTRKRHSDGGKFWGCIRFPKCRGTRDMTEEEARSH